MACNSDKCHCPNCEEERRSVVAHPDNHVTVAGSRVVHRGPLGKGYRGYGRDPDRIWHWQESRARPGLWRKWDIEAGRFFGAPWSFRPDFPGMGRCIPIHTTHHVGGFVAGPNGHGDRAREYSEQKRVGEMEQTHTVRFEGNPEPSESWVRDRFRRAYGGFIAPPPPETEVRQVDARTEYAMTPIMLEIMLHAYYVCEGWPRRGTPAYREAVMKLKTLGLITETTDEESDRHLGWRIKATERGAVYVKGLLAVALPMKAEPEWRMP